MFQAANRARPLDFFPKIFSSFVQAANKINSGRPFS